MNVMFRNPEKEVKSFKISFYIEHDMPFELAYISNTEVYKTLLQEQNLLSTKLVTFFVFSMTILRITVT